MKLRRAFGLTGLAALLVGVSSFADEAVSEADLAKLSDPSGVVVSSNVDPKEMVGEAEALVAKLEGTRTTARRQLEAARQQRDVVKTLCLNDKLNQIDVAIRSARERRQALGFAVSRNDSQLATHEFTILMVLKQRGEQLASEANQCVGEEAGAAGGEAVVSSTVDPNVSRHENPTVTNSPIIGAVVVPAVTPSPTN